MKRLELLAPAKNLECGIAAIDHGADAVYIGAQRFGARAAAGNSLADIGSLCQYAHRFGAKVYVTVNTIVYDSELDATRQLLGQLAEAGADAILVQDMALLPLTTSLPTPLILHASTQTDNRTSDKVRWLRDAGFRRVVLARELSVEEIAEIHRQVPEVELEVFVHGALCVSYSGRCYVSQHCFGRSANRGACAQVCRMQFDLLDADGHLLEHQRHLLSLKDLCQIDHLEELIAAGATSFKIEGRLKDADYVKNVVAAYDERLNAIVRRNPARYTRASLGRSRHFFQPDLSKTFNRGYTTYFLHGRQPAIFSPDTPKAVGAYVGQVKSIQRGCITVAGSAAFSNGDGLCFVDGQRQLQGFRVNRAEGNHLYPHQMPSGLTRGMSLYRNSDQQFERLLSRPSAERKIAVALHIDVTADGFSLSGHGATASIVCQHQRADKPQHDNIVRQLSKLGGTIYECSGVDMPHDFNYFIPSSQLADLRRRWLTEVEAIQQREWAAQHSKASPMAMSHPSPHHPDDPNIANHLAADYYGTTQPTAYELQPDQRPLMQCRHCLRYALGYCVRHGGRTPLWREPLSLRLSDGRRFRLEFDCRHCQMNVYAAS